MAEVELLAPLAELLMPQMPIAELFRSFPSPKGWGGNYLEPDLTAYGVLKNENAALFVEYDGYWRHAEKEGLKMDKKKNAALLQYAPKGSFVVRISHTISKPLKGNVLWVKAETWRAGGQQLVSKVRIEILKQTMIGLNDSLHPEVVERFHRQAEEGIMLPSPLSTGFISTAAAANRGDSMDAILSFLRTEGFSNDDIDIMQKALVPGMSIDKLRPKLQWLSNLGETSGLDLGLTKSQVAKAVATHPQILGLSMEQNLKPTVQWFLDLGLTKSQVAKAVATHPQILGLSMEQNLKPTVQWFLDLGLTKSQVAKALATYPQMLGLSIEQNLKPTAQWFLELGLTKSQVAKAAAAHPPFLWYSIQQNLKPTVQWLLELGLTKSQLAKAVATHPQILGLSIEQNLKPTVQWFLELGLTKSQVAKALATYPQILGLSIEQNLKPTVQWFLELGLTKSQVAKAVATFSPILWYSMEQNLYPKILFLNSFFGPTSAAELLAKWPQLLGYSYHRLAVRLKILAERDETHRLITVMSLTEEAFQKHLLNRQKSPGGLGFCFVLLLLPFSCKKAHHFPKFAVRRLTVWGVLPRGAMPLLSTDLRLVGSASWPGTIAPASICPS